MSVRREGPVTTAAPSADQVARLVAFAQAARGMSGTTELDETLRRVVEQTALTFAGIGVSLVLATSGDRPGVTTVTHEEVGQAEALRLDCAEGPASEVLECGGGVRSDDLGSDPRWYVWGPRVAGLGFRSVASVPVWDGLVRGVLTAYSHRSAAFNADDLVLLEVYAVHVSAALTAARELRAAEGSRQTARAEGILMERFGIDASQAAAALRLHAVRHASDPVSVARHLVEHRTLSTTHHPVTGVDVATCTEERPGQVGPPRSARVGSWIRTVASGRTPAAVGGAL